MCSQSNIRGFERNFEYHIVTISKQILFKGSQKFCWAKTWKGRERDTRLRGIEDTEIVKKLTKKSLLTRKVNSVESPRLVLPILFWILVLKSTNIKKLNSILKGYAITLSMEKNSFETSKIILFKISIHEKK